MKALNVLVLLTLVLGVASLFVGEAHIAASWVAVAVGIIDYAILALLVLENVLDYRNEPVKSGYFRRNLPALSLAIVFVVLFLIAHLSSTGGGYGAAVVIVRNLFIVAKVFTRFRKLSSFLATLTTHPAQTILLSFLLVILVGCLVLMMPFCTVDDHGLSFLDALFTSTSAVCVTGLIVVDTATALTTIGQVIVLLLIQIGGLGIMLLSFFTLFALGKRVSIENKLLLSYMLSQEDMSSLVGTIKSIVKITAVIEGGGAILLFSAFVPRFGFSFKAAYYAVFHSISAFCNAGFALFSDSLEQFRGDVAVNLIVSLLIILGGISFAVMANLSDRVRGKVGHLTLNTRVVLIVTAILLTAGTFIIYGAEHGSVMKHYSLGEQYLSAFFQSVTLRTAGFNTVPFGSFRTFTYMEMMVFMFIGAASGSTAGGIKVGTVAVLAGYVAAVLRNRRRVTIMRQSISQEQVVRAFLILVFGLTALLVAFSVLSLSERLPFRFVAFEAVSAFGTVGLSAGITSSLSAVGRIVIIVLMFLGRLGPLTVLAAATQRESSVRVEYPQGILSVG